MDLVSKIVRHMREAEAIVRNAGFNEEADKMREIIVYFKKDEQKEEEAPLEFQKGVDSPSHAVMDHLEKALDITRDLGFDEQSEQINDLMDYFDSL